MRECFKPNPLALSIPNENLEAWVNEEIIGRDGLGRDNDNLKALQQIKHQRKIQKKARKSRGSSPDVTLIKGEKSWKNFLYGAYSRPRNLADAKHRLKSNLRHYLANYTLVTILCMAFILYIRPKSALGAAAIIKLWEIHHSYTTLPTYKPFSNKARAARILVQIATWFFVYLSNLTISVLFAIGLATLAICCHAVFRWAKAVSQEKKTRRKFRLLHH